MHMVSTKDLNSAELEIMRKWMSPTTVMTTNGEVRTNGEATVFATQLDFFVTVMLLEETPAGTAFFMIFNTSMDKSGNGAIPK